MKSDYRIRAKKFLKSIFPYIDGYMWDVDDVMYQVEKYNYDKKRHVLVSCGSARIALITSDYVIKWDYDNDCAEEIGVVLKRAQYFILCGGKRREGLRFREQDIARHLLPDQAVPAETSQLSLFDPVPEDIRQCITGQI